jgi:hypothetical protein
VRAVDGIADIPTVQKEIDRALGRAEAQVQKAGKFQKAGK